MVRGNASNGRIGTNADGISDDLERNVIAGSDNGHALQIEGSTDNLVAGNFIGVGLDGATDLGNAADGIRITSGSGNLIGGSSPAARNLIGFYAVTEGIFFYCGFTQILSGRYTVVEDNFSRFKPVNQITKIVQKWYCLF